MRPLHSKWRCALCGEAVETALVFALVNDSATGIAVGECCYEKLREPGVIMDPAPIFLERLAKEAGFKGLDDAYEHFEKEREEKQGKDPTRLPKGWATIGSESNKIN